MGRIRAEFVAWLNVLESSALYAAIIVTFVMQVARVEGQSMDPTLKDQDRLIVNKLAYHLGEPQLGDVVMMRYPIDPDKSFVKRMIAREGDTVQIVSGEVRVNGMLVPAPYVSGDHQSSDDWGPEVIPQELLLRARRQSQQQFRQPQLRLRAQEVHHRQSAVPMVAALCIYCVLSW